MPAKEPIAIVGIGCRFPGGADSTEHLWKLLIDGVDAISEVPASRWHLPTFYHPNPAKPGRTYARWGGFLKNVDHFDAQFFGISPKEAAKADPQQRLLLEVAYEALEDAGLPPERIAGTAAGVFVGISTFDYGGMQSSLSERTGIDAYTNLGSALSIAANRISYFFDIHGPSLAIDTACSSSLVAAHLACQSVWNGECELAFIGGVNLILRPEGSIGFCKASMLAPDGRCKSFDARADGFVRAEGAGVVLVKPLSLALSSGDTIYAVIRATAVNQDGRTSGISMPNQRAQEAMLREALSQANLSAEDVQYVEAHGTGTPVGDPIEAAALGRILGIPRPPGDYCRVGSIKTNIGHAEAASGIAGLIKTALCLKHARIPGSLHFESPNPQIAFEDLNLRVVGQIENWPQTNGRPRRAGVNSFGFGGTNAHVILESAPEAPVSTVVHPSSENNRAYLLPLSARSEEALAASARAYSDLLTEDETWINATFCDFCYSASLRRGHHDHRLAVVAHNRSEAVEYLRVFLEGETRPNTSVGRKSQVQRRDAAFVCSGMGQQWWGMGRELLAEEPVYRETIESIDALLRPLSGWSLLEELMQSEEQTRLNLTFIAQPAIFAMQVGLAAIWRSWGIEPSAVVGHSVGEVAAAHIAGAFTLEDAVRIIFHRSRLQQRTAGKGTMLAAGISLQDAEALTAEKEGSVSIAAINSPRSVTLTGNAAALEDVARVLNDESIFCRFLQVDVPYHSPMMEPLREEFLDSLQGLNPQPAATPLFSTVKGGLVTGLEMDAEYWWLNIRNPVQFKTAISEISRAGHDLFVEIGAHPILKASLKECLEEVNKEATILPSLRRKERERAAMLGSLGQLYTLGTDVDWRRLYSAVGLPVKLPLYVWQREKHWHESEKSRQDRLAEKVHPLLGMKLDSAQTSWEVELDPVTLSYLEHHQVQGSTIFPAAGYVEMALAAAGEVLGDLPCVLEDVVFRKALFLSEKDPPRVQVTLDATRTSFEIQSRGQSSQWVGHAGGKLRQLTPVPSVNVPELSRIRERGRLVAADECYRKFAQLGLNYGPMFQGIERLWVGSGEALAEIRIPDSLAGQLGEYRLHPVLLDSCFQVLLGALYDQENRGVAEGLYLPTAVDRIVYRESPGPCVLAYARLVRSTPAELMGDIQLLDQEGNCQAEIRGFACRSINRSSGNFHNSLYEYRWKLKTLPGKTDLIRFSDHLPSPCELVPELRQEILRLKKRLGRDRYYTQFLPAARELAAAYIARGLRQLGWNFAQDGPSSTPEVCDRLAIAPEHRRLFARLLKELTEEDFAVAKDPQLLFKAVWEAYPDAQAELTLMRECGEKLAEVLRGEVDPLNLIFPQGSDSITEHLYQDSPTFRIFNLLVKRAIETLCSRLPQGRVLRMLEIGGGTAGLTAYVLPVLPPDRLQYVFTDVAPLLVSKAEQKLSEYPFVEYRTLDIEDNPANQGFEPHSFDVILASDVLHATRSIQQTIEKVGQLLGSKGLLILLEGTRAPLGIFLVFGLLKGWWLFEDEDVRGLDPWIEPQLWQHLLEQSGFTDTEFVTDCEDVSNAVHSVILARGQELTPAAPTISPPIQKEKKASWVIFADSGGSGRSSAGLELAAEVEKRGDCAILISMGEAFRELESGGFQVRPHSSEDLWQVVHAISQKTTNWRGIAYLWSLGADFRESSEQAFDLTCNRVLHLVQSLGACDRQDMPQLWLVTRGAHYVPGSNSDLEISQSLLWGLGRVIMNEYPRLHCRLVDLEMVHSPNYSGNGKPCPLEEIQSLAEELYAGEEDDEIAIRGDARYVHRLSHTSPTSLRQIALDKRGTPFKLVPQAVGVLEPLVPYALARCLPSPGEVEIEIQATGLNFKDVMLAMGLLPEEAVEAGLSANMLGMECAGTITAIGQDVREFAVGDHVIACGPGALASHLTIDARFVVHKPTEITFEEGATLPIAFLTAHYALNVLGQMGPGDRVLIHAATGGVGLAALQLAQHARTEVFATAGSDAKRSLLRALGVPHVMDSRSLTFADEVLEATGGEGVDLVLNSLSGAAIPKSLSVLRPFGRFLEIGKRDIYEDSKIGLWPFRKNISFFAVALDRMCMQRVDLAGSLLRDVIRLSAEQRIRPLSHRVVPAARVANAFRAMAQAKHIGKVVISLADKEGIPPIRERKAVQFEPDGTYLITGGLGGIGLALAEWLVRNGARHLVLIGRTGAGSSTAQAAVNALEANGGADVITRCCDVTDREQLGQVIESVQHSPFPLRGVFHAAMVLDDAQLQSLDEERMWKAIGPKALGAWNLHILTAEMPLDFFVLFSSFTSVIGNAGQANYVAGNSFLDALAWHRRLHGLPALTVNWGAISDAGYLAENPDVAKRVEQLLGVKSMPARQMFGFLGELLAADAIQVGVAQLDWQRTAHLFGSHLPARFCDVVGTPGSEDQATAGDAAIRAVLDANPADRKPLLEVFLREHLAKVLATSLAKLDTNQPLASLGLDSLMAMEMRTRIQLALGVDVPPVKFLEGVSISGMATFVADQLELADGGPPREQAAVTASIDPQPVDLTSREIVLESARLLEQLEQLTDEEVDTHLRQRVAHSGGD